MAIGDIVSGMSTAVTTNLSFQPAAGVEVCILTAATYNGWVRLDNGTNTALIYNIGALSTAGAAQVKIMINNTNYLFLEAAAGHFNSYTGMQIK